MQFLRLKVYNVKYINNSSLKFMTNSVLVVCSQQCSEKSCINTQQSAMLVPFTCGLLRDKTP